MSFYYPIYSSDHKKKKKIVVRSVTVISHYQVWGWFIQTDLLTNGFQADKEKQYLIFFNAMEDLIKLIKKDAVIADLLEMVRDK